MRFKKITSIFIILSWKSGLAFAENMLDHSSPPPKNKQHKESGWCEFLTSDGHWVQAPQKATPEACKAADQRSTNGHAYAWQETEMPDTKKGQCYVEKDINGYSYQYQTSKKGCENHDKNGSTSYHWTSDDYPVIYVNPNHRGYGFIVEADIPDLCDSNENMRICQLIQSYHLPQGWGITFFSEPNYQGDSFQRSAEDNHDNYTFTDGHTVRSIKVKNPNINPPKPIEHKITSLTQVYFGVGDPSIECGSNGRLLSAKDIDNIGGNKEICYFVSEPWAIWKFEGHDKTEWSFMGRSYGCEMKPKVGEFAPSLCVMKSAPHNNQAYLFTESNFMNREKWHGMAEVKSVSESDPNASFKSFILGEQVRLEGYSEKNFQGTKTIYDASNENTLIQSYKLLEKN